MFVLQFSQVKYWWLLILKSKFFQDHTNQNDVLWKLSYLSCDSALLQARQVRVAPRTGGPRRYRPQIFIESKVESLISLKRSTESLKCYLCSKYWEFNIFEALSEMWTLCKIVIWNWSVIDIINLNNLLFLWLFSSYIFLTVRVTKLHNFKNVFFKYFYTFNYNKQ